MEKKTFVILKFTENATKDSLLAKDDIVYIDKLDSDPGTLLTIPYVSMLFTEGHEKDSKIGTPLLSNVEATVEVLSHGKNKKIIVYKYKAKKNSKTKQGHVQEYTKVRLVDIIEKN